MTDLPPSNRSSATSTGLGIDLSSTPQRQPTGGVVPGGTQVQRIARAHGGHHAHSSSTSSIPFPRMDAPTSSGTHAPSTPPRGLLRRPKSQSSLSARAPGPGELFHGTHRPYEIAQHGSPSTDIPILPWRQPSFRQGIQQGYQRIMSSGSGDARYRGNEVVEDETTLGGPRYESQQLQGDRRGSTSVGTAPVPRPRRDREPTFHPPPMDLMTPAWERRGSVWSPPTPSSEIAPSGGANRNVANRHSRGSNLPWSTSNTHLSPAPAFPATSDKRRSYGPGVAVQSALGSPYTGTPAGNDYLGGGSVKTTGSNNFPMRPEGRKRALSEGECQLHREGTLLTAHATTKRASAELGIMLGNSSRRASKSKLLPQGELPIEEKMAKLDKVKLEARKGGKAKVEVDVILENDEVVEGGEIRGRLEVRVRKAKRSEKVWIGSGKIRIVGYEEHSNTSARHIFYHYPYALPSFTPYATEEEYHNPLFASGPDDVGYRQAAEGNWVIPFSMRLPVDGGAKGGWSMGVGKPGVKYVVVGSIKLHTPESKKRAIAHFYRPCIVYPQLDPALTLAASVEVQSVEAEGGLGWSLGGQRGKVSLSAKLHRRNWVAGQKVWIGLEAENMSTRKVKSFTTALIRTITIYTAPTVKTKTIDAWASPDLSLYKPNRITKKLWEEVVEASTGGTTGYLGATSWWTGVEPGARGTWQCHLTLPADCVTVTRSRLLDVSYSIRVTLNAAVHVDLPLTIINFLSLDPPPGGYHSAEHVDARAIGQALLSAVSPVVAPLPTPRPLDTPHKQQPRAIDWAYDTQPLPTGSSEMRQHFSFPLTQVKQVKSRPLSVQSALSDQFALPQGRSADSLLLQRPSRPTSLTRSASTPPLNSRPEPPPRRDTTMSYLSAVGSSDDDHDLAMIEARRRAGRQQSLAAILGNRIKDTLEEEDEEIPTPPSQTFAPFSQQASPQAEDSNVEEEVRNDLDFVRAEEEAVNDRGEEFERDSESRCLERDLKADGEYRSRMGSNAGLSVAELSVSEYPSTEAHDSPVMATSKAPVNQQFSTVRLEDSANVSQRSSIDRSVGPMLPLRAYGSIAASAISAESEVGQVVQAFRRDLSLRAPRKSNEAGLQRNTETSRSVGDASYANRLPFTSRYMAIPRSNSLNGELPSQLPNPRSNSLDTAKAPSRLLMPGWTPRSNSLDPTGHGPTHRRPSAPGNPFLNTGTSPKSQAIPGPRSPGAPFPFNQAQQFAQRQHYPAPVSPKSYALGPALFGEPRRPSSPLVRRAYSPIPEHRLSEEHHTPPPPGLAPSDIADSSSSHDSHGSQCESITDEDPNVRVRLDSEDHPPYYPETRHGSAFELDDAIIDDGTPHTGKSLYSRSDRFGSVTRVSPSGPRSRNGMSPKMNGDDSGMMFPPAHSNGEGRTAYTAVFASRQRGERPDVKVGDRRDSAVPSGGLNRASSRASIMSNSTTATMAELALLHHAISTGHLDAPSLRRTDPTLSHGGGRDLL